MQPFLHLVADKLHQRFRGKMHRLAVVFPNRRQSVFFSHYLQQIADKPCFMPAMITIEELVAETAGAAIADGFTQSFALYDAFKHVSLELGDSEASIPPFDVFYHVGETILKDFREMDSYLVNVAEVCKVLYDIEAIDKAFDQLTEEQKQYLRNFWNSAIKKSAIQEKFLKLWERLPQIYQRWMFLLREQQLTTMGIAYRQLAGITEVPDSFSHQWDHLAFVGFNAFNRAEETFLKRWNDAGYASCWFDTDEWYLNQPVQEAGLFMRKNMERTGLKNELPALDVIGNSTMPVEVIGVEGQHAQAKQLMPWWNHLQATAPKAQAGILLADESLLLPVLQSLPEEMGPINVTMGYPLQQSVVYSLFQLFFEAHFDMLQHGYQTVHHTIVTKWLQHPFCQWPQAAAQELHSRMVKQNLVRVPLKSIAKENESSSLIFSRMMADMQVFDRLRHLLEGALKIEQVNANRLTQGLCVAAWKMLHQLEPLFASLRPQPELAFMGSLLMKQLGSISVPFEGEPLQGVQLMGLLESRGLDFDHLIILGASEGSLPRIKAPESYLPDNVRRAFGLPVPEFQDAIFAYVFYRLLHRSSSIRLVYNSLVADNSTGVVSRFAEQIAFETKMPVLQTAYSTALLPEAWPSITIPKTPEILSRLQLYRNDRDKPISLSPSALNTYLHCRLQFFFKYLAKLEEPEELEEGVKASSVGSVVHKLMELVYEEAVKDDDRYFNAERVATMRNRLEYHVEEAFRQKWYNSSTTGTFHFSGELHVVRAIVLQYADFFLLQDETYAPFTLKAMEVRFQENFSLVPGRRMPGVVLSGYIDRVDEKDGLYRMADYKTGGDKPEFTDVASLFERDGTRQNKAALQTLIYSWMYHSKFPAITRFEPALLAARHLQLNGGKTRLRKKIRRGEHGEISYENIKDTLAEMETHLRSLLKELFDPTVPFDQTTRIENCSYCDFAAICGRT